jgi:hypothetical protein
VKFFGIRCGVKGIIYTDVSQELAASIERFNEYALMTEALGSY